MDEKKLTIYFTSDLHGYIYPTDYRGQGEKELGLFKCASRFRKDGNTLVIDGGDILQGSPLGAFCHDTIGSAARFAEMMNRCGYDYVTLGNHDFNYGMPYLDSYLNVLKARCVCENVRWDEAGVRFPARIHTLENGLRVGIIGIVTDYVNIWEKPEHLAGIAITDPIPAVAAALGKALDREVVEADELIAQRAGMSIPEIFARSGEETFRKLETAVLAEQGKRSGIILSTGGGCVTRPENYPLLHQNGTIFRLTRDLAKLPTEGRPISQTTDLAQLCARREPLYRRFADVTVSNDGALEVTVQTIKEALL